jgi:chlorite dismutase
VSGAERSERDEGPRDFVKYTFYRLLPEWRRLPIADRAEGRAALVEILERPSEDRSIETYGLVGLKANVDFLLWTISPRLEPIVELHARVAGSPLGAYLETPYSYLGMGRVSEYVGPRGVGSEGTSGRRSSSGRPYLFVYPFVKKREWYGLPFEERRRIMGEHLRLGHQHRTVEIHTGYSFGLDDPEFILAFESDEPGAFLDLVQALRPSEASRYTELETPIFTCVRMPAARMLELAEGLP